MDFDSIITFILLIVFFVLPSVIKQIQARKKKAPAKKKQKKKGKVSLLSRINDQIQAFLNELEKQSQRARKQQEEAAGPGEDFWESLSDGKEETDEAVFPGETAADEPDFVSEPPFDPDFLKPSAAPVPEADARAEPVIPMPPPGSVPAAIRYTYKRHPLQNAVVWSEILGKPVALRGPK